VALNTKNISINLFLKDPSHQRPPVLSGQISDTLGLLNSEIIAFIYYCDLRKFSQIVIFIIAKHEVLQYKWILMIPKFEV